MYGSHRDQNSPVPSDDETVSEPPESSASKFRLRVSKKKNSSHAATTAVVSPHLKKSVPMHSGTATGESSKSLRLSVVSKERGVPSPPSARSSLSLDDVLGAQDANGGEARRSSPVTSDASQSRDSFETGLCGYPP